MAAGKIIFLNGTSSAGKTTLAHALQERLGELWIHIALDQFRDGLPPRYRGLNAPPGTAGEQGLNVVPMTEGEQPWTDIRFGDAGTRMLKGMRRAIAAMASAGNNVIVDDIILREAYLNDYLHVLKHDDVFFVGVKCPKPVISQREQQRPGRFPGTAVGHFDICHAHDTYDVAVDTSIQSPAECAASVLEFMETCRPRAFHELYQRRCRGARS